MKTLIFKLTFFLVFLVPFTVSAAEKELIIEQMNNCINTLTNIINNKSMTVLEHETDQLLNNLTIQQVIGLPEIADFRTDLIEGIGKLSITEEERSLLRRINSIKQDNLKWQVFSNALNNTMMITGGGNVKMQIGFQALVTAARAGVEYKMAQNELQMEELQAMWDLRKEDLERFIELRKEALQIVFKLYQKYNLKESDRLTEQTSQQFQKITSETDASRMVRLLLDNNAKFGHLADYYYYLGMGYIDMKKIPQAMEAFKKYDMLYSKAPIFRVNEKSGLISLTRLAYSNNLSPVEIERELKNAQRNLPSNTMAMIQCAAVYNSVLHNPTKALSILRSSLDDENAPDKAAIIIAGSLLLPKVSKQSQEYKNFLSAYSNQKIIDLDAVLNMCIATNNNIFKFLSSIIKVEDLLTNDSWYSIGNPEISDKIKFIFPKRYSVDLSKIKMFVEKKKDNQITVSQYILENPQNVTLEDIDKVNAFKDNPKLKYLYLSSIGKNLFTVKEGIDYKLIDNERYPHQSEFQLSDGDRKDIIKFLKKYGSKSSANEIIAERKESTLKKIVKKGVESVFPIGYTLFNNFVNQADGTYVKFSFDDSRKLVICYKLDTENKRLIPCYTKYQGKVHFANKTMLQEFGYGKGAQKASPAPVKKSTPHKGNKKVNDKKAPTKTTQESGKPWWKIWGSDEDGKKAEPAKPQNKTEKKKESAKESEKSDKPWWKIWGSDEDSKKTEPAKQQNKTEKKKESAKESEKSGKPWWNFWGSDRDAGNSDSPEQQKEDTKKAKSDTIEKSEKSWWKFW